MTTVRFWRGVILATKAEQYLEYLNRIVIPACQTAEGNEGVFIMKELQGELAHFLLFCFWSSKEELEKFASAGACEVVNPFPEEKSLLIAAESNASHYKIVYSSNSSPLEKKA